jgi:hypothetical protein
LHSRGNFAELRAIDIAGSRNGNEREDGDSRKQMAHGKSPEADGVGVILGELKFREKKQLRFTPRNDRDIFASIG